MKRQILFRGKRVDNGEWVYGYYFVNASDQPIIIEVVDTPPSFNDPCGDRQSLYHFVYSDSVGQFTGLTDKNGVKIFEGDLLKGGIFLEYEVKWDGEESGWNITESALNFYIIGNIHNIPELLS